jgi:hypothetical protein
MRPDRGAWAVVGSLALVACVGGAMAPVALVLKDQQERRPEALAFLGSGRLGQTFRATAPGLSEVAFVVTSDTSRGPMARVQLRELPGRLEVLSGLLPSRLPARRAEYVAFRFAPVWSSADRRYELTVERVDPTVEGTLKLWGAPEDVYPDGTLTRDGREMSGDLAFRLAYRVSGWEALRELSRRLAAQWRDTPGAGAMWLALLAGYGLVLARLLVRLGSGPAVRAARDREAAGAP